MKLYIKVDLSGYNLVDNGEAGVPVKALYDYEAAEPDELTFKTGQISVNPHHKLHSGISWVLPTFLCHTSLGFVRRSGTSRTRYKLLPTVPVLDEFLNLIKHFFKG